MSQYQKGTVDVTNGSQIVTGNGTEWLNDTINGAVTVGDRFSVDGSGVSYTVASVDTDTQITLNANYAGVTASAQAYHVTRDFTLLNNVPVPTHGDVDTASIVKDALEIIDPLLNGPATVVTSMSHKGAWAAATTYIVDDAVSSGGRYWRSLQAGNLNHTPPSTAADDAWWSLISDVGADGSAGPPVDMTMYTATASASQTVFDATDFSKISGAGPASFSYTADGGHLMLWLGGVLQTGFSETSTTSITLASGAALGEQVVAVVFADGAPSTLPSVTPLAFLRGDAAGAAFESRTPAQTLADIGGMSTATYDPNNLAGQVVVDKAGAAIPVTGAGGTLTPAQWLSTVIVFTGTLTANEVQVIPASMPPHGATIINNTTGNFSLSIKHSATAAIEIPRGLAWGVTSDGATLFANRGGYAVLQRVTASTTTPVSTNSGTFVSSGLSAVITPKAKSSIILIRGVQSLYISSTTTSAGCGLRYMRNGSVIDAPDATSASGTFGNYFGGGGLTSIDNHIKRPLFSDDTPATLTSVTYRTDITAYTTSSTVTAQPSGTTASKSKIELLEVLL